MKSFLIFAFLLVWHCQTNAQEQTLYYSQAKSKDGYGEIVADWHAEQNTFVFNANGTSDILWIRASGSTTTFSFLGKTTGYDEDGYYYEQYETTTWNAEFEDEDYVDIRLYEEGGLLVFYFWDWTEAFLP